MTENGKLTNKQMVEDVIVKHIHSEYTTGESNNLQDNSNFEAALDMFDNVRTERDYDWQSNIPIPEFLNAIQGQTADDANAYFARKEYVSVNVQSKEQKHIDAADAAKDLIDKTLSKTSLNFFQKYIRLSQTKNIGGRSYVRCWWEQDIKKVKIPVKHVTVLEDVDINGQLKTDPSQESGTLEETIEEDFNEVIRDRFAFDVIDPRNIVYSAEYEYNLRNKNWIILRFDTTVHDLKRNAKTMGYINLDQLEGVRLSGETEAKLKVVDWDARGITKVDNDVTPVKNLMVIERWGMDYAMVTERDVNGHASKIEYGYDAKGEQLEGAELVHLVQNVAILNGESSGHILIRHELNPYKDNFGNPYIPLARGLCYIHPTKDRGFGDDVGSRGLQKAINDTFNANNDNTLMGMLKIIKQPEGYDEKGDVLEDAELVHLVQNVAILNGESSGHILIRHELNPYKDNFGNPYIPLARGLCYIHPTKDRGFGDDVGSRGLQKAINDTFNANNDNTLMGMLKIIKQPEGYDEDEMPLRIEPMAIWPANTEVVDFASNTVPALNQLEMLTSKFNETNARDSGVPVLNSAAATTVARAEKQVNVRSQYKNLVFEHTMMGNLYWMIIMMSSQFMLAETAIDMLGEKVALDFNADLDYHYKPISESIETDSTAGAKIDRLNTALGYVMNSQNAKAPSVANGILKKIFKLMGKEEEELTGELFDEESPLNAPAGGGAQPSPGSPVQSAVNQGGGAQPSQEQNQGAIQ